MQRLIGKLQDDDFNVCSYAAYALGQIKKDAIPALIQSLQDQDLRVSASAAEALGKIGTPEALEAVKEYEKSNW